MVVALGCACVRAAGDLVGCGLIGSVGGFLVCGADCSRCGGVDLFQVAHYGEVFRFSLCIRWLVEFREV